MSVLSLGSIRRGSVLQSKLCNRCDRKQADSKHTYQHSAHELPPGDCAIDQSIQTVGRKIGFRTRQPKVVVCGVTLVIAPD